jgi:putative DNA primase/helicase
MGRGAAMIETVEANFPAKLRALDQWVGYKIVLKPGDKKPTKVPYSPNGDFEASTTEPKTWSTFETACAAIDRFGYDGQGFVFTKHDPYAGIDFDNCVVNGRIDPEVWDWVQRLDSYAEYSPSETGIHVVIRGVMPEGKGRKHTKRGIEMYDRGRYFTVTGRHVEGTPTTVNERQTELDALYAELFPKKSTPSQSTRSTSTIIPADDKELIDRMFGSANGDKIRRLWDGDTSGHSKDHSSADLALCNFLAFWTGNDAARMDRLFRRSKLYRDKWDRKDYRDRTINAAIADTKEVYKGTRGTIEIADPPTIQSVYVNGNGAHHQSEAPKVAEDDKPDFRTDLGNARRFTRQHGQNVRFVDEWGFVVWDGKAWRRDQTGQVMRLAKKTVLSIFDEASTCMRLAQRAQGELKAATEREDADAAKKATEQVEKFTKMAKDLNTWALTSQGAARLEAMIKLAKSEMPIPARPEDFDKDPWLLNCDNGTIDQRTGTPRPHRREDLITKLCPVEYNPDAQCPTWLAALSRWMDGKQHMVDFLQRLAGYSITGDVSEQILPFLFGDGSNGKSTYMGNQLAMLGKDYATQAAPELLTAGREGHPTELADLRGMRLVASIEVDDGKRMAEGLVKQLTGGDKLKARFMRQDFFEFSPTHKIFLIANHKPVVTGTDHAIWRRVLLIPFTVKITEEERDPSLSEKLQQELAGILTWAVQGCLQWQKQGLQIPEEVKTATNEYRIESDVLLSFLDERTTKVNDAQIKASKLYKAWESWCEANGEKPRNGTWFGNELKKRGYVKEKNYLGVFYRGIGLVEAGEPE